MLKGLVENLITPKQCLNLAILAISSALVILPELALGQNEASNSEVIDTPAQVQTSELAEAPAATSLDEKLGEPNTPDVENSESAAVELAAEPDPRQWQIIGERFELESMELKQLRHYQVHLPNSYYSSTASTYPVLYLLDGERNFHAISGMVEHLSTNSDFIPEMIVVAVASESSAMHRFNMTPATSKKKTKNVGGNAHVFAKFLQQELKTKIESEYRTADYAVLVGQADAGLFVVNNILAEESAFNAFIAISPKMWWQDNRIEKKAEDLLNDLKGPTRKLYLSLANENRLGVYGLVEQLDRHRSASIDWQFKKYPNENHDSVTLTAVADGLKDLFSGWYQSYSDLSEYKDFQSVRSHYQKMFSKFEFQQSVPEFTFRALMHQYLGQERDAQSAALYLQTAEFLPESAIVMRSHLAALEIKSKNFDKAGELLQESFSQNPESYLVQQGLAKLASAKGEKEKSRDYYALAIELATQQKQQQWLLSQLNSELLALDVKALNR